MDSSALSTAKTANKAVFDQLDQLKPRPRILALDGGGLVRPYISLLILEKLMNLIQEATGDSEVPKPCDCFNLICGTGMGGVLALMLGRLRMSVEECKSSYDDLISRHDKPCYLIETASFLPAFLPQVQVPINKSENSSRLRNWFSNVIGSQGFARDTPLKDPSREALCRTFVLTTTADSFGQPRRLRTYSSRRNLATDKCSIGQAALAAAALSFEFEPVRLGDPEKEHMEAGLGYNNPAREAIDEAIRIWSAPIHCLVNIGTGPEKPVPTLPFMEAVSKAFDVAIDRERVAKELTRESTTSGLKYFRLDVVNGLDSIATLGWDRKPDIERSTQVYLKSSKTMEYMKFVVGWLLEGAMMDDEESTPPPSPPHSQNVEPGAMPYSIELPQTAQTGTSPGDTTGGRLFDSEVISTPDSHSAAAPAADAWMAYLKRVHNFLEAGRRDTCRKIKVAVLDTGIAYEHHDIAEQGARIIEDRDWTSSGINDEVGHGTHIAALLLKVAPAAHIYIAKVLHSTDAVPQTADHVSSAIKHAVEDWKVDIITMSFGFLDHHDGIFNAIEHAIYHHKVIFFAAASNHGSLEEKPAFPARLHQVFCIHSACGHGSKSRFNPLARPNNDNFMLLGEEVESAWPTKDDKARKRRQSGTSIATPIAAGIAALVLEFAYQGPGIDHRENLRRYEGMRAVFYMMSQSPAMPSSKSDLYYFVKPWELFKERSSGRLAFTTKQAVELLKRVVVVQERTLAEEHPGRLASQSALAGALADNGQIKQVAELLKHMVLARFQCALADGRATKAGL